MNEWITTPREPRPPGAAAGGSPRAGAPPAEAQAASIARRVSRMRSSARDRGRPTTRSRMIAQSVTGIRLVPAFLMLLQPPADYHDPNPGAIGDPRDVST